MKFEKRLSFEITVTTHCHVSCQTMDVGLEEEALVRRHTIGHEINHHRRKDHRAVDNFEKYQHFQCSPHGFDEFRAETHDDQINHHQPPVQLHKNRCESCPYMKPRWQQSTRSDRESMDSTFREGQEIAESHCDTWSKQVKQVKQINQSIAPPLSRPGN
jgi:hypothetical protein